MKIKFFKTTEKFLYGRRVSRALTFDYYRPPSHKKIPWRVFEVQIVGARKTVIYTLRWTWTGLKNELKTLFA